MNTPDQLTITLTRGRGSISRSMDLQLMDTGTAQSIDELYALYEETRRAFNDAHPHLAEFWQSPLKVPEPTPPAFPPGHIPSLSSVILCPSCKAQMSRTAPDSWCCYPCKTVWSLMAQSPEPEV